MAEQARWRDVNNGTESASGEEYKPDYEQSWAVLIGINRYLHHNSLSCGGDGGGLTPADGALE